METAKNGKDPFVSRDPPGHIYIILLENPGFLLTNNICIYIYISQCFVCSDILQESYPTSLSLSLSLYIYIYIPESSKGLKFGPLNHQKQTQGLKFDTLGGSRYIFFFVLNLVQKFFRHRFRALRWFSEVREKVFSGDVVRRGAGQAWIGWFLKLQC